MDLTFEKEEMLLKCVKFQCIATAELNCTLFFALTQYKSDWPFTNNSGNYTSTAFQSHVTKKKKTQVTPLSRNKIKTSE